MLLVNYWATNNHLIKKRYKKQLNIFSQETPAFVESNISRACLTSVKKSACVKVYNTGNHADEIMKNIPPFSHILQLFPLSGHRGLEPIPAAFGREAGYILDKPAARRRITNEDKRPFTLTRKVN